MIKTKAGPARLSGVLLALALTAGVAVPAQVRAAPAPKESPLEETRYWLGCFAGLGVYESITKGLETDLDRARMSRLDLVAPRMDERIDELAATVGEDTVDKETEATYTSVTGVARALAGQQDGTALVIAKYGPLLDACSTRGEALPLPAPVN